MWRARVRRVPAGASAPCHRARCCWQGGREARAPQLRAAGTQRTEKPSQKRAENGKGYPEKKLKTVLVGRVFLFLGLFVCFFFPLLFCVFFLSFFFFPFVFCLFRFAFFFFPCLFFFLLLLCFFFFSPHFVFMCFDFSTLVSFSPRFVSLYFSFLFFLLFCYSIFCYFPFVFFPHFISIFCFSIFCFSAFCFFSVFCFLSTFCFAIIWCFSMLRFLLLFSIFVFCFFLLFISVF